MELGPVLVLVIEPFLVQFVANEDDIALSLLALQLLLHSIIHFLAQFF